MLNKCPFLVPAVMLMACIASGCRNPAVQNGLYFVCTMESLNGWMRHPSLTTERAYSGEYAAKIGPGCTRGPVFSISLNEVSILPIEGLEVGCMVFSTGNLTGSHLQVAVLSPEDSTLFTHPVAFSDHVEESGQWVSVEQYIPLPAEAVANSENSVHVSVFNPAPDPLFVDDLTILFHEKL